MSLYQKMGHIDRLAAVAELREEIADRFGPLPPPARNLFTLLELKVLAQSAGVAALRLGAVSRLEMQAGATLPALSVARLAETFGSRILFKGSAPLAIELRAAGADPAAVARKLLQSMEGCATELISTA